MQITVSKELETALASVCDLALKGGGLSVLPSVTLISQTLTAAAAAVADKGQVIDMPTKKDAAA